MKENLLLLKKRDAGNGEVEKLKLTFPVVAYRENMVVCLFASREKWLKCDEFVLI